KEEYAFNIFAEMELDMDLGKTKGTGQLFKTSLEKSLFSSPAACIKSIDARLGKIKKKYKEDEIKDIRSLEELKGALENIEPNNFSRYQKLLSLLNSDEYGWTKKSDDRIVIFTERIETMKYLAENLRKDLGLKANAVVEISGSMSDAEQQEIVENFGREEAPVRVLVASDVASEGLNLHYLSHRMIHFDIPWSLMVFQQRNGRIDRYGQQVRPDIRYMLIESDNNKIKGDMRIMEILITKEEQALKNIGDPALLLGKFSIEDEELVIIENLENGADAEAFEKTLDSGEEAFDPFEILMQQAASSDQKEQVQVKNEDTIFSDIDYLQNSIKYLNRNESQPVEKLQTISGLDIKLTADLKRRLRALVPEEALPQGDTLRLSDDKEFCMQEMIRSMQNNMAETAWPKTQYLWALHPIITWANDKNNLLFARGEAPLITVPQKLNTNEIIYIMTGSIPNAKSQPLVDEWFGLMYRDGKYEKALNMREVLSITGIGSTNIPNTGDTFEDAVNLASELLPDVVNRAKAYLHNFFVDYQNRINPLIDDEIEKLGSLESKHKSYQLSFFSETGRRYSEEERRIDELFDKFTSWVNDTLEIKDNPYIRVIAVAMGGK
ncbi:MAG: hypothetical protein HUJ63_13150, partial [Enterococcus sp.]|nr:hypothetical protein [Enterococcus sp.]